MFSRMSQCFDLLSTFAANNERHFFYCSNSMHSKQMFSLVFFTRYLHTAFIADYWCFPFFRFLRHHARVALLQNVRECIHAIAIGCSFAFLFSLSGSFCSVVKYGMEILKVFSLKMLQPSESLV